MREFLQSYKIVTNIEQKASKNKHLARGFENTAESISKCNISQLI